MKRLLIGIVALVIVGIVASAATGRLPGLTTMSSTPQPTPTTGPVKASGQITAEGQVVPVRQAQLALPTGGTVAEVRVEEGQRVESGMVLLRLDRTRVESAVRQAEAGLQRSEAQVAELVAGPRQADVDAALAAVDSAKMQLAKLQEGPRPEDVRSAEAALAAAQATLLKTQQGPDSDVLAAATNDLAKLKAGPTAEDLKAATLAVEQAKSSLWSAQTSRDGICGNPLVPRFQCDAANAQVATAETQIAIAQNNVAAVKAGPRPEDIATAQARVDKLLQGATAADTSNARAQVAAAQARLETLKTPARESDLNAAQAEVRRAAAQVAVVKAPARPEAIAAAQADVAAARATLDGANAALAELDLKAPFDGVITSLTIKQGEFVQPGVAIGTLADTSAWQIETTDLTELNVARIHAGQSATVTFDAIPGLEVPARVTRVGELGTKDRGDILYTITMKPDRQDDRFLWNMTAVVTVQP